MTGQLHTTVNKRRVLQLQGSHEVVRGIQHTCKSGYRSELSVCEGIGKILFEQVVHSRKIGALEKGEVYRVRTICEILLGLDDTTEIAEQLASKVCTEHLYEQGDWTQR